MTILAITGCETDDASSDAGNGNVDSGPVGMVDAGGDGSTIVMDSGTDAGGEVVGKCTDALADDSACLDVAGTKYDIPVGSAMVGQGSQNGNLVLAFSQDEANTAPRLSITYSVDATPGTVKCDPTDKVEILINNGTDSFSASKSLNGLGSSCEMVLVKTGKNLGDAVEGSFTAKAYTLSSGAVVDVSGRFKTSIPN
ncbi:MAG: hypothetical protein KC416_02070 [Myxococcales bacterium]|nr:hypothetical protein [Myxococcales bacterium]